MGIAEKMKQQEILESYVTCDCGCGTKDLEPKFLYDCANDMYFLRQKHADRKWGVKRDRKGFVK